MNQIIKNSAVNNNCSSYNDNSSPNNNNNNNGSFNIGFSAPYLDTTTLIRCVVKNLQTILDFFRTPHRSSARPKGDHEGRNRGVWADLWFISVRQWIWGTILVIFVCIFVLLFISNLLFNSMVFLSIFFQTYFMYCFFINIFKTRNLIFLHFSGWKRPSPFKRGMF